MTHESSNRDLWLSQIEQNVKAKVGDRWRERRWSDLIKEVVWWLHNEKERNDEDTIDAAAGLINYGIETKEDLLNVAGDPTNRKDFREALDTKGVLPMVCDLLFTKYIPQQQQEQQDDPLLQNLPVTSRFRRDVGPPLVPPSIGKEPKEESDPKGSPSSDEGIAEGLSQVAIEFVGDLHEITTRDEVEEKFSIAANYVYNNWHHQRFSVGKKGVYKNQRWLTGIVCNALNLVLRADGGLVALHQGCIGSGSTHSDLSISAVGQEQSPPLLVGEGKQDSDIMIRETVRGQLFNELVRHRRTFAGGSEQRDFRPVLLMALNTAYVSLELAFPTTKDGHLKINHWITPEANAAGDVVFFTVQIAFINIDSTEGRKKLAQLFCFIEGAVKKLRDLKEYKRDQWKTPWIDTTSAMNASKRGDNVTVVDEKRVYKEFCYYLRQQDGFNTIPIAIDKQDQRKPPPGNLLQLLGKPYSDWICRKYAGGWFVVLEYDFIQGDQRQVTKASWMSLLRRIATLHDNGYVHGDILPRNMLFSGDEGYIIDFDLMKQEGQQYVSGYNHMDFEKYRQPDAQAQKQMKKTHDVHALAIIAVEYFGDATATLLDERQISTIEDLILFFGTFAPEGSNKVNPADSADPLGASSSPFRD